MVLIGGRSGDPSYGSNDGLTWTSLGTGACANMMDTNNARRLSNGALAVTGYSSPGTVNISFDGGLTWTSGTLDPSVNHG